MTKLRQDAWSQNDDVLLAKTVLKHIAKGSTQLKAFDEVGDLLNRTSAACGFRWNAEVRKDYYLEIEEARRERKKRSRLQKQKTSQKLSTSNSSVVKRASQADHEAKSEKLNMKEIIYTIEQWAEQLNDRPDKTVPHYKEIVEENKQLKDTIDHVEQMIKESESSLQTIQANYTALLQQINHVRQDEGKQKTADPKVSLEEFIEQINK